MTALKQLAEGAGRARGLFLGASPDSGLDDALPQSPGEEGNHEQLGEQDPRHGVAQAEQRDAERQRHQGADVPKDLGQSGDAAPGLAGRRLGDQRPRGGHVGPDGQPDHEVAEDQHPGCLGENDPQHAERVEQQVPLVDPLAPQPITDAPPDQGPSPAEIALELNAPSSDTKLEPKPNCLLQIGSDTAPATIEPESM